MSKRKNLTTDEKLSTHAFTIQLIGDLQQLQQKQLLQQRDSEQVRALHVTQSQGRDADWLSEQQFSKFQTCPLQMVRCLSLSVNVPMVSMLNSSGTSSAERKFRIIQERIERVTCM
jgi:hypothetical protein